MEGNPYLAHLKTARPRSIAKADRTDKIPGHPIKTPPGAEYQPPVPKPELSYGNYPAYYGYRHSSAERVDSRLLKFKRDWFEGRRVLDIGCNAGLVSIEIAQLFHPASVEGVDIDPSLIRKSRQNLRMKASLCSPQNPEEMYYFPENCLDAFGITPIVHPEIPSSDFPHNINFRTGDWLNEPNPSTDQGRYHVILVLSVSKWIHLNEGDAGIEKFFRRVFNSLLPGGLFIFEPQPIESYQKKANTKLMRQNLEGMQLRPEKFPEYLLGEIKFRTLESLGTSHNETKGFQRPMYLFYK